jgi:hypothetical protein
LVLDLVLVILRPLAPEQRVRWLEECCPRTAASLGIRQNWSWLTDLEESA